MIMLASTAGVSGIFQVPGNMIEPARLPANKTLVPAVPAWGRKICARLSAPLRVHGMQSWNAVLAGTGTSRAGRTLSAQTSARWALLCNTAIEPMTVWLILTLITEGRLRILHLGLSRTRLGQYKGISRTGKKQKRNNTDKPSTQGGQIKDLQRAVIEGKYNFAGFANKTTLH